MVIYIYIVQFAHARTSANSETNRYETNNCSLLGFVNMGKRSKQSDTSQRKKKGRRGWTTEAQEEFLTSYIPSYLAEKSGSSRIRSDFWPPIWEEFFERWPLQLISDKEKEEDKVDPDHLEKAKTVSILSVYNVDITHVTT